MELSGRMGLPRKRVCRIWVEGKPQSAQKGGRLDSYVEKIRAAAKAQAQTRTPHTSKRLMVEVWFCRPLRERPDVDNVLKPILDAMEGVVYVSDRQVR